MSAEAPLRPDPESGRDAKGYVKHERQTLEAVIAARASAQSANLRAAANPADAEAMKQMAAAEAGPLGALGKLFALSEAYPRLQGQPDHDAALRGAHQHREQDFVRSPGLQRRGMSYNTAIESFPDNFVAGFGGFKEATLLESTESPEERKSVKVSFRLAPRPRRAAQWISSSSSTAPGATRG